MTACGGTGYQRQLDSVSPAPSASSSRHSLEEFPSSKREGGGVCSTPARPNFSDLQQRQNDDRAPRPYVATMLQPSSRSPILILFTAASELSYIYPHLQWWHSTVTKSGLSGTSPRTSATLRLRLLGTRLRPRSIKRLDLVSRDRTTAGSVSAGPIRSLELTY